MRTSNPIFSFHLQGSGQHQTFLFNCSPGAHLIPSAINISLSHSAMSLTGMSLTLFRKNPISDLVLKAITSLNSHRALLTLSLVTCYMTFKPAFITQRAALTLEKFRTPKDKMFENHLKWWVCLLHFCFVSYLPNLPLKAHVEMPL